MGRIVGPDRRECSEVGQAGYTMGMDDDLTLMDVLATFAADGFTQDMFVTSDAMVRCGACHHDTAPDRPRAQPDAARSRASPTRPTWRRCSASPARSAAPRGRWCVRFGPEAEAQDDAVWLAIDDQRFSDG